MKEDPSTTMINAAVTESIATESTAIASGSTQDAFKAIFFPEQVNAPTPPPESRFFTEVINGRKYKCFYDEDNRLRKLCEFIIGEKLIQNIVTGQTRFVCRYIKTDGKRAVLYY